MLDCIAGGLVISIITLELNNNTSSNSRHHITKVCMSVSSEERTFGVGRRDSSAVYHAL